MVIVHYFSWYIGAEPRVAVVSAASWHIYEQNIVRIYGNPRVTYKNNGSHFTKGIFPVKLKDRAIRQVIAPITHPSSVGLAELVVKLVFGQLRKVLQLSPERIFEWDDYVQSAVRKLNGMQQNPWQGHFSKIPYGGDDVGLGRKAPPSRARTTTRGPASRPCTICPASRDQPRRIQSRPFVCLQSNSSMSVLRVFCSILPHVNASPEAGQAERRS
jgi:hypothetical protein